jgi:hypothetical protein
VDAWNRRAIAVSACVTFFMIGAYDGLGKWGLGIDFAAVLALLIWMSQRPVPPPPMPTDQELGDELSSLLSVGREPPKS